MEYEEQQYDMPSYQEQVAQAQLQQMQQQAKQEQYSMPVSKDRDFMQWLFNLKEQTLAPLRHTWRGEIETNPGAWEMPEKDEDKFRIMNERGITWGCSVVADYLNPVFIISNYDGESMNWVMRGVGRVVWNGLAKKHEEFDLDKINIPKVSYGIIHQIHAILLGARGNGYREFFMSTHHYDNLKTSTSNTPQPGGFFGGFFKKKQPQVIPMAY